jgi:hypothetical protein
MTTVASVHPDLPFRSLATLLGLVPCQELLVGGLGRNLVISVEMPSILDVIPLIEPLHGPYCKIHDQYALETTVL